LYLPAFLTDRREAFPPSPRLGLGDGFFGSFTGIDSHQPAFGA
jgi:hypothetical protein